jgi:hypothetical protein
MQGQRNASRLVTPVCLSLGYRGSQLVIRQSVNAGPHFSQALQQLNFGLASLPVSLTMSASSLPTVLQGQQDMGGSEDSPHRALHVLASKNNLLLPPANWRWVKEGGGYVRHEAWPHTPTVWQAPLSSRCRHSRTEWTRSVVQSQSAARHACIAPATRQHAGKRDLQLEKLREHGFPHSTAQQLHACTHSMITASHQTSCLSI